MINVFIIGSKGIPARYGGFETFVENLTKRKQDSNIHYFVSCMGAKRTFEYNDATCFSLPVKIRGPIGRIINVSTALSFTEKFVRKLPKNDDNFIYILGCRIGPFLRGHEHRLHKLGCKVICNPDGLEWKRGKWNKFEKKFLKFCEKELIKWSDFVICDSVGIQDYILKEYGFIDKKNTTYLSYGCDSGHSTADSNEVSKWFADHHVSKEGYYLVVGRFVPENNIELIIREFMASRTNKDLLLVTNLSNDPFFRKLKRDLDFEKDPRIKFVGTIYDAEKLKMIRELAFAYIHGHSVGGTNPSLLEAMSQTKINILFDVSFNREVGQDEVLYFSSKRNELASLIDALDKNVPVLHPLSIVEKRYSWPFIVSSYEIFFETLAKK